MKKLLAAVGVSALLTVLGLVGLRAQLQRKAGGPAEDFAEKGAAQKLEPLWPVPAFALTDQAGQAVTSQSLRGRTWVVNFVFTQCRTICPLLTARMVQLQRKLRGADVTFVSVSVDPAHDTPEVLAAYAKTWAPDETRWKLLATTKELIPSLAKDFHVIAEESKPGDVDPIIHSSVFLLVDRDGTVRGAFDSEMKEDFLALERGARELSAAPPAQNEPALPPEELYHVHGCAHCHERAELAPPLFGRAGQLRELESSLRVPYDLAYVRESLVVPEAKRPRGYPLKMPSYDGVVAPAQLDALSEWILSRPAVGPADSAAEVAEDPICHMKVRVTPDSLSAEVDGKRHYFCAESCRARYVKAHAAAPAPSPGSSAR